MKVQKIQVENFGSYPSFEHDFTEEGLSLVYGATGSGKSTFMDVIPWILFGVTAKNGAVDEVRSWQSPNEPTTGHAWLDVKGVPVEVTRVRGKGGQNDLFWIEGGDGQERRGKDLLDSQKRLDELFGISADAYLNGSYLHEFSGTGTFWTASAKDRRKLFERVAPLEFPATLAVRASEARKDAKAALGKVQVVVAGLEGQLKQSQELWADSSTSLGTWEIDRQAKAQALALRAVRFETDRQMDIAKLTSISTQWQKTKQAEFDAQVKELEALSPKLRKPEEFDAEIRRLMDQSRCTHCKALPLSANSGIAKLQSEKTANGYNVKYFEQGQKALALLDKELSDNPHQASIMEINKRQNTFQEEGTQLLAAANPFTAQVEKLALTIKTQTTQVRVANREQVTLEARVASLTRLYELSFELRGQMLQRAVQSIQDATNALLERYFDAEIRVTFSLETSDTLEVEIQKSGYDCAFRQLSKGQRGLLKLAFGVSVMEAVANMAGTAINILFMDEALDGLDEALKVKAHGLFEELATRHPSVYVIDHSPGLQSLMDRRYHVTLRGDMSEFVREA